MPKRTLLLMMLFAIIAGIPEYAAADGLPVAKYLEDREHKNEIFSFYLNSVFTGINLANNRMKSRLFCMENAEVSAFEMIDRKINKLRQEKLLNGDMTVDDIMLDVLLEEYPCK